MALILDLYGEAPESIVDGPGLRYIRFSSHRMSIGEILSILRRDDPYYEESGGGITISGGEPFCQAEALCELARAIKALGLNIYIYSGYTIEQLLEKAVQNPFIKELLYTCDTLVDGPYIEQQRNLDLLFRGSENQRIIDLHTWPGLKN